MEKTISVICVDASGKNDLVVGNIYEVTDAGPTIYRVVSGLPKDFTGERFFFKSRFQEVGNHLLKVGDKVCLRTDIKDTRQLEWISSDNIKQGIVYEVHTVSPRGSIRVVPKDGARGLYWVNGDCFNLVSDAIVKGSKVILKFSSQNDEWVKADEVAYGFSYEVRAVSDNKNYVKVSGHKARGSFWIAINHFYAVTEEKKVVRPTHNEICLATFKKGDRVRFLASKTPDSFYKSANHFTKQAGLKPTGIYTVRTTGVKNGGDAESCSAYIELEGHEYCHPYDCFELVKEEQKPVEAPKPVETKKPRLMLCVDMSDSSSDYTVGKVYELVEEDNNYYHLKSNDSGWRGGGMFKHRFIEIKDEVLEATKVLCTDNFGYEKKLTVGKTYLAYQDTGGDKLWKITPTDNPDDPVAVAYKVRFTEVKDEVEVPISKYFKIGDKFKVYSEIVYLIKQKINSKQVQVEWQSPSKPMGTLSTMNFDISTVSDYFKVGSWVKITEAPKQETPKPRMVYCIDNKMSYAAGELTIGKKYEVLKDDTAKEGTIWIINDKGIKDWYRSTRFSDTNPKREWKVGDTLLASFLNDRNINKEFLGYDKGWNEYSSRMFVKDRKIEEIAEREGKLGARISGTWHIWITLESLEKHP